MIKYSKLNNELKQKVYDCYNNNVGDFYKKISYEDFCSNLYNHIEFDENGVFVAVEDELVVGFIACHVRGIEKEDCDKPCYISTFIVDKKYRHEGIGKELLDCAEQFAKENNKHKLCVGYVGTLNWPWYIPNTDKHDHNGAPGACVNSDLYCFLLNNGFDIVDEEDAFHLDLSKFKMPQRVIDDLEKLAKNNIIIELYDANKHYGLEEFYEEIQSEPFERVIRYNLGLDNPNPFAVVSEGGKVAGWTGAFYTEPSGRAHFDGIIVAPHVRGNGLGRALFATLAQYSKENGSSFMTFFTGRTNFARYIYLSLGFKIIQSFAVMEKEIK